MRKKRTKIFRVERGHLAAEGATKAEAKAKLESMIDWALRAAMPTVEFRYGLMLVIGATPHGYCTTVIDPAKAKHGAVMGGWCQNPQEAFTDALESIRNHAAQIAWTHECADDAAFVAASGLSESKARDLAGYIAWQRLYRKARNAGADDNLARDIAGGIKPMTAIPAAA